MGPQYEREHLSIMTLTWSLVNMFEMGLYMRSTLNPYLQDGVGFEPKLASPRMRIYCWIPHLYYHVEF